MPESTNVLFVGPLDRVLVLKTLPGHEELDSEELVAIAQNARERFFPRGAKILSRGHPPDAFYVVLEGSARRDEVESRTDFFPGEPVGFLELVAGVPPVADVVAESPVLALEFPAPAQADVWEEHFPVILGYVRHLASIVVDELRRAGDASRVQRAQSVSVPERHELNLVERVLTLRQVPTLSTSSLDALAELSRHLLEERRPAGDVLWRSGDRAGDFYVLLDGSVRCESESGSAATLAGGFPLGLHESLGERPRWCHAIVERDVWALRMDVRPFIDLLEDHFPLARHVVSEMARSLLDLRRG